MWLFKVRLWPGRGRGDGLGRLACAGPLRTDAGSVGRARPLYAGQRKGATLLPKEQIAPSNVFRIVLLRHL